MKILYFANPLSPHDAKWINAISKNHQVEVVAEANINDEMYIDRGVPIHAILKPYQIMKSKRKDTLNKISQVLNEFKPDVLHSMYLVPNAFWADEVKGSLPHIITTRGSDILSEYPSNYFNVSSKSKPIIHLIFNRKLRASLMNSDQVTCTSEAQNKAISKITNTNCAIIPTGIQVQQIMTLSRERSTSGVYEIFCPRYLKPNYNIHVIIKAFKQYITKFPDSRLTLMKGSGQYAIEIETLVSSLGLTTSVRFINKMGLSGLVQTYSNSDLVVMIPESDGTPNTALEAMVSKVPVLLGKAAYDETLFSKNWVWRLSENSTKQLLEKLLEIRNSETEFLQKRLTQAQNIVISNASLDRAIDKINSLYANFG